MTYELDFRSLNISRLYINIIKTNIIVIMPNEINIDISFIFNTSATEHYCKFSLQKNEINFSENFSRKYSEHIIIVKIMIKLNDISLDGI